MDDDAKIEGTHHFYRRVKHGTLLEHGWKRSQG
jgi:hypothetical protein